MRYAVIFLLATVADFVAAVHIYTLARDWITLALLSGFLMPFAQLPGNAWFADAKTFKERLLLTFCTASGVVTGSGLTLLLFRK